MPQDGNAIQSVGLYFSKHFVLGQDTAINTGQMVIEFTVDMFPIHAPQRKISIRFSVTPRLALGQDFKFYTGKSLMFSST